MFKKILFGLLLLAVLFAGCAEPEQSAPETDSTPSGPIKCYTAGCAEQICTSNLPDEKITTCEWLPEYGCNKNCALRNGVCSFDEKFKQWCLSCVEKCLREGKCEENCYVGKSMVGFAVPGGTDYIAGELVIVFEETNMPIEEKISILSEYDYLILRTNGQGALVIGVPFGEEKAIAAVLSENPQIASAEPQYIPSEE